MLKPISLSAGLVAMLGISVPALAADPIPNDELQQLKARVTQLEQEATQPPARAPANGNAFNPKISLILDGSFAAYSAKSPPDVAGFLLGDGAGPRPEGLSLGESELAIESNIDQSFHGWTTLSLAPEGGVSVEEAYINTLALPAGFALKFGRFFSEIGYQNHQHAHAWEFVDAPLVYRAMLGNQLGDDGLQVRWLAPTDLFLELGAEALRGAAFPGGGTDRSGVNGYTGFAHLGGDVGTGGSWRLGLSHLKTNASDRRSGDALPASFTGNSNLSIVDAIYKWAPEGNPTVTNLVAQAEYFFRRENGGVLADPDGAKDFSAYRGHQSGYYAQVVYQFMPRWRVGTRYDHLSANNTLDNPALGTALAQLADTTRDPHRVSVMADFSNSEFSRFRLQYSRDESRPGGETDNQVLVQYIFSLGSHPAHQF